MWTRKVNPVNGRLADLLAQVDANQLSRYLDEIDDVRHTHKHCLRCSLKFVALCMVYSRKLLPDRHRVYELEFQELRGHCADKRDFHREIMGAITGARRAAKPRPSNVMFFHTSEADGSAPMTIQAIASGENHTICRHRIRNHFRIPAGESCYSSVKFRGGPDKLTTLAALAGFTRGNVDLEEECGVPDSVRFCAPEGHAVKLRTNHPPSGRTRETEPSMSRQIATMVGLLCVVFGLSGCLSEGWRSVDTERQTLPQLLVPLRLADFDVVGPVTPEGAKRLMRERIWTYPGDSSSFLSTNGLDEGRIQTETVADYQAALRKGASTVNNFDIVLDSLFLRASAALRYLEMGCPASTSLPEKVPLWDLSVSFLGWVGSEEEERLKRDVQRGMTLGSYRALGRIRQPKSADPFEIHFAQGPLVYRIVLLARGADVNRDGREDALVFVTWHYLEGTGQGAEVYLATEDLNGGHRLIVEEFDQGGKGGNSPQ